MGKVKKAKPLKLGDDRVVISISQKGDKYCLKMDLVCPGVPGRPFRKQNRDKKEYDDEVRVWMAIRDMAADRIASLTELHMESM